MANQPSDRIRAVREVRTHTTKQRRCAGAESHWNALRRRLDRQDVAVSAASDAV